MDLNSMAKKLNIDWTNFTILFTPSTGGIKCDFEITPREFLEYAKQNYSENNTKGLVDALSNAKRAIDCQIDWIISFFGYNYGEFNNRSSYPNIENIIEEYQERNEPFNGIPVRLEFIQALNIAPSFLVSKIRKLRNKLEHEYIMPTKQEVKEAVEVAELFIYSSENVIYYNLYPELRFSNNLDMKLYADEENENWQWFGYNNSFIHVVFSDYPNSKFKIFLHLINEEETKSIEVNPEDNSYIYLVKVVLGDFDYLAKAFGVDMNLKFVNYTAELN